MSRHKKKNFKLTPVKYEWNAMDGSTFYDVEMDGVIASNVMGTSCNTTGLAPGTQHIFVQEHKTVQEKGKGVTNSLYQHCMKAKLRQPMLQLQQIWPQRLSPETR